MLFRSRTKNSTLAILFVVVVTLVLVGWIVISPTGKTATALASNERRSIALQSPGVVLRQSGNAMEMQTVPANCAKGFVRRGSVCEVDAATQTVLPTALSKSPARVLVRPAGRE